MTKIATGIGFWAAAAQAVVGYSYLVVYIAFMLVFPVDPWVDIATFAAQIHSPSSAVISFIQFLAFLQALFMVIIAIVIHEFAAPEKKILTHIGMAFALAFMLVATSHYYVQWASVRQSVLRGDLEGLGMFVQFNFDSPLSAVNILGWTFFNGIANLAIGPVFGKDRLEKWIKWGFICNGINGILSSIFFAIGAKWIMLPWVAVLSGTWYVYPLLALIFYRAKMQAPTTAPGKDSQPSTGELAW